MSVSSTTKWIKEIRRKTRRKFSSEEKIRIVLEGLRDEWSREGRVKSLDEPPLDSSSQWADTFDDYDSVYWSDYFFDFGHD